MSEIPIYYQYDGEWKKKENGSYEWLSRNDEIMNILFLDDPNKVKFSELHDRICERTHVDRINTYIKLSYIPLSYKAVSPKHIMDDVDAKCYFLDHCNVSKRRSIIYVELIKKDELQTGNDKGVFKVVDDERYDNGNDESCRDEYFNINVEEPRVYDITSASGREGDILNELMSGENVLHQDTISIASAPTPNRQSPRLDVDVVVDYCEPLATVETCKAFSFVDGLDIEIGHEFRNKMEVKNMIINASLKSCFDFNIVRSTTKLFVAKCKVEDCKWALRATNVKGSDRFSLRTYCNIHTCSSSSVDKGNQKATSQLVADMLAKEYPGQMDTPMPYKIMEIMRNRGIEVSYYKAWMGKCIATSNIRGKPELNYEILPSYLHVMSVLNPGTVTYLATDDEKKFKCLFFALGACIEGFKVMRKVIAVDATFLKTIYGGTLLVCTAQDGNKHQYPLAFAIVKSESDESWNWFLVKLEKVIPDSEELVIISDRHSSIIKAVSNVYKKAEHGFCAWHISQNVKSCVGNHVKDKKGRGKMRETIQTKFMAAAAAYTEAEFKRIYADLTNRYPIAHKYLEDSVDVKKWARCYFVGSRYNILTTNEAESINSALKTARTYPLIPLIDAIMMTICKWFSDHRKEAGEGSSSQCLTPKVEKVLHARYQESKYLKVKELNRTTSEYCVTGENNNFLVNLEKRTCTCKVYDIDQLPCVHALGAFSGGPNNMHSLCSTYYLKEIWALAYRQTIYPVPNESEWVIPDYVQTTKVLPPEVVKKHARI